LENPQPKGDAQGQRAGATVVARGRWVEQIGWEDGVKESREV
jgi:hypothetical protein